MKNPSRDLSRVIHTAISIVIGNLTLHSTLSSVIYSCQHRVFRCVANEHNHFLGDNCPGNTPRSLFESQDFGSTLFGAAGGIVFALCVAASCFGALNSSTFTTARLIYVAGREGMLPSMFGQLHPKRMTPVKALVLQGVLSSVMVMVGDFGGLVLFAGVAGWS